MTERQKKELLKAQQGEIDAVLMYNALADAVSSPEDADTFRRLAAEEGRHGSVFKVYTGEVLKPKSTKAVLLPMLYRLLGKERLYPLIAKGEYDAEKAYEHLIPDFPEVEGVRNDEKRHGDTVKAMLEQPESPNGQEEFDWKAAAVGVAVFFTTWTLLKTIRMKKMK